MRKSSGILCKLLYEQSAEFLPADQEHLQGGGQLCRNSDLNTIQSEHGGGEITEKFFVRPDFNFATKIKSIAMNISPKSSPLPGWERNASHQGKLKSRYHRLPLTHISSISHPLATRYQNFHIEFLYYERVKQFMMISTL